jgi:hypothetical protein
MFQRRSVTTAGTVKFSARTRAVVAAAVLARQEPTGAPIKAGTADQESRHPSPVRRSVVRVAAAAAALLAVLAARLPMAAEQVAEPPTVRQERLTPVEAAVTPRLAVPVSSS